MTGSTRFSAIDLTDGFYQILMREKDVPLTAVSTPSGMLWEWLVMPQGLTNAPATFNRCVTHIFRSVRAFAPSYFDDVFIHSKAEDGKTDVEMHRVHLRRVFDLMRKHQLYANVKKCIFGAEEIPVLGCFVGKHGVRADPEKVNAITEWPVPRNEKELRKFLGLATYLHKYSKNYAEIIHPLSQLLRKDSVWNWTDSCQSAFERVKQSLTEAPILAIADPSKPYHVVCDASNIAIGCALLQHDSEGRERVISYQSRQLKPAERNYPVHDRELLAMKYALAKFRVYLLGADPFTVFTDHCSLRTAVKSPHLSQRMARWLSFFAEYNFSVEYKPGRLNVVADALSRRPDFEFSSKDPEQQEDVSSLTTFSSVLLDTIKSGYESDDSLQPLLNFLSSGSEAETALTPRMRSRVRRFTLRDGLLYYSVDGDEQRVVVPNDDDLRKQILLEYHAAPQGGHLGREKTYVSLTRDFYWPHQYKWVRSFIRTCEICQRVKPSRSLQAPLQPLPIPDECWTWVTMDFAFGFPKDRHGHTGILVFVDRLSKMVHIAPCTESIDAAGAARLFIENVFRLHGMPQRVVSDRDPRFTSDFWQSVFEQLGTTLHMSTAHHPETDGQSERAIRVVEDILRSYAHSFDDWSDHLPLAEFAINNSVHSSTGQTPFYLNGMRHPRVPAVLGVGPFNFSGGGSQSDDFATASASDARATSSDRSAASVNTHTLAGISNSRTLDKTPVSGSDLVPSTVQDFVLKRQAVVRFVRDSLANAVDRQKENADRFGRKQTTVFNVGDYVLLSTSDLPTYAVSNEKLKLQPRFIGPFRILNIRGSACTLDIPAKMRLHPTFYVGRLKPYLTDCSDEEPVQPAACSPSTGRGASTPLRRASRRVLSHRVCDRHPRQRERPLTRCGSPLPSRGSHTPSGHPRSLDEAPSSDSRVSRLSLREDASGRQPLDNSSHRVGHPHKTTEYYSAPPPLRDSEGNQRWLVEAILDRKPRVRFQDSLSNQVKYLVKWRGYPPHEATWEPRQALLEDVPDVVREYEARVLPAGGPSVASA